jgi:multidrug efflux pump subunit AcrA (membrane-fusion protein)
VSQGTTIEQQPQQKQGADQQGRPQGNRSQLVQRLLDHSVNLPAFIHDLLQTQAVTVAGTEAAAFLLERTEQGLGYRPIAHIRPDQSTPEIRAAAIQAFQDIVKPCVQQGKDGAIEVQGGNDSSEAQYCLVTLLRSEGEVVAVSAVITRCRDLERARQRLQSMLLVAGYFDVYAMRRSSDQARVIAQSHQHVLQLATSVATATGFQSAANNLCNELATRSNATRVTIGWLKGRNIRVKALSHTEQFDKKQELIVEIERAMEECHDQEEVVQFDPNGKSSENVTRAHQALSRSQGGNAVLSIPLRHKDEICGVVTLEFLPNQQLGPQVASGLGIAVELLAPQLWDRYNNDRWLITKAGISTREMTKLLIGPKHMIAKLVGFAVVVAILIIFNIPYNIYPAPWLDCRMTYRVSAPFKFVAKERRTISAPFEGEFEKLATINGKLVEPGTVVKKGDVLGWMRRDELASKERQARAKASEAHIRGSKFLLNPDRNGGGSAAADAYAAQADEQAALAEAEQYRIQIEQAEIKSPMDGVVLTGDLKDKQGAKFDPTKDLFTIGRLDSLQAEINVNERDLQLVQEAVKNGKKGEIATRSEPRNKYPIAVDRIVPMGDVQEGANTFRVYANLEQIDPAWLPGMIGEARLEIEKKPLAWVWTHRLIDWLRLKTWL